VVLQLNGRALPSLAPASVLLDALGFGVVFGDVGDVLEAYSAAFDQPFRAHPIRIPVSKRVHGFDTSARAHG